MATLEENVMQAIADFDDIKAAFVERGIEVPNGTDTKEYGNIVRAIPDTEAAYNNGYSIGYSKGEVNGYNSGKADGYMRGYDEGIHAEHDRFWDAYQQNGERTEYNRAFREFNDYTFRPKYDIRPTDATYAFYNSLVTDLKGILEECGVVLDFSKCTAMTQVFMFSTITRLPTIDASSLTNFQIFTHCHDLVSVDKVILKDGAVFTNPFHTCTSLRDIDFEGYIMNNGVNFQWSNDLTHDSLINILNALYDYSDDTSGTVWTVTIGSTNKAKLTTDELEIAEQKGWYVA